MSAAEFQTPTHCDFEEYSASNWPADVPNDCTQLSDDEQDCLERGSDERDWCPSCTTYNAQMIVFYNLPEVRE